MNKENYSTININEFYGKVFDYRLKLLNKRNLVKDKEETSPIDAIDLYITSNSLAYMTDFLLLQNNYPSMYLSIKNIMEGMAIKQLIELDDFSALQEDIFRLEHYITEYNYLSKFKKIKEYFCDIKQYKKAYEKLYTLMKFNFLDLSDKEIKDTLKSDNPFILDLDLSIEELLSKCFDKHYQKIYKIVSSYTSPYINNTKRTLLTITEHESIIGFLYDEYNYLPISSTTFNDRNNDILLEEVESVIHGLMDMTDKENDIITKIINVDKSLNLNNYLTVCLINFSSLMHSLSHFYMFGLYEQVICKWQEALELIATMIYVLDVYNDDGKKLKLYLSYEEGIIANNKGIKYAYDKAYSIYQEIDDHYCTKTIFKKKFLTKLGFTIGDDVKCLNQYKLINEVLKDNDFKDICTVEDDESFSIKIQTLLYDYLTSLLLTNNYGYMWFTKIEYYLFVDRIISNTDGLLLLILNKFYDYTSNLNDVEKTKYKKIINVLRNAVKDIKEIILKKQKLLS